MRLYSIILIFLFNYIRSEAECNSGSNCEIPNKFAIHDRGYWQGTQSIDQHVFDEGLAEKLVEFFKKEEAKTIIDLGAGMGDYTKKLINNGFDARAYDGNPQSQIISNGYVGIIDLTLPINFSKADWVLTLEVAEHLPARYERVYLDNIDRMNKKGIILSWAIIGQGGAGHVNERNNDYVKKIMSERGYISDDEAEAYLREGRQYGKAWWFYRTIMVFRKINK